MAECRARRICPWREEIVDGLLGSSILGFHTREHCNRFVDTVDSFIETRIDREHTAIVHAVTWSPAAASSSPART